MGYGMVNQYVVGDMLFLVTQEQAIRFISQFRPWSEA